MVTQNIVGIDIAKENIDVFFSQSGQFNGYKRSDSGLRDLTGELIRKNVELVVLEATGGYEKPVARAIDDAGIKVAIINPRQIRDFARATGQLAKTDLLDAKIIARYGERIQPEVHPLPSRESAKIRSLNARRQQLLGMLNSENNRIQQAENAIVTKSVTRIIKSLKKELKNIDDQIAKAINGSDELKKKQELLQSVPGVGKVLSATLVGNLPQLGSMTKKQIAAFVGVAPINRDSGKMRGRRITWGGNASIRRVLYMGALVAIRHNSVFKTFYERLLENGKAKKVALIAVMRKLIVTLNAMVKNQEMWAY